jgi:ACT domain-containing protein
MALKNAVGRPPKLNLKIVDRLAYYIERNYSISDSCKYVGLSRDSYYRYLKTEPLFADTMAMAQNNANKVSLNFRTYP